MSKYFRTAIFCLLFFMCYVSVFGAASITVSAEDQATLKKISVSWEHNPANTDMFSVTFKPVSSSKGSFISEINSLGSLQELYKLNGGKKVEVILNLSDVSDVYVSLDALTAWTGGNTESIIVTGGSSGSSGGSIKFRSLSGNVSSVYANGQADRLSVLATDNNTDIVFEGNFFNGYKSLKEVYIRKGKDISFEDGCFTEASSLRNLTISENSKTENSKILFGSSSFYGCTSLRDLKYYVNSKEQKNFRGSISNSVFYNCVSLQDIIWPENGSIAKNAFFGCIGLAGKIHDVEKNTNIQLDSGVFVNVGGIALNIHEYGNVGNLESNGMSQNGVSLVYLDKATTISSKAVHYAVLDSVPVFTGLENGTIYPDSVKVTVKDDDLYWDSASYKKFGNINVFLDGKSMGISQSNESFTSFEVGDEGDYTVKATDFAGNKAEITFGVDRTPPVFYSEILKRNLTDGMYLNTYQDIKIIDRHPSSYGINGTERSSEGPVSLNSDGVFDLTATDKAGNSVSAHVTVDTIAPTVRGVSDGGTYYKAVTVTVADENLKEWTLGGTQQNDGSATVSEPGDYSVVAEDKAGNRTELSFSIRQQTIQEVKKGKIVNDSGSSGAGTSSGTQEQSSSSTTSEGTSTAGSSGSSGSSSAVVSTGSSSVSSTKKKVSVTLKWKKVKGTKKYKIYRKLKGAKKWKKIATTKKKKYVAKGLKTGKTYLFKVKAKKKTFTFTIKLKKVKKTK